MTVRRTALETLLQINEDGAFANLALKDAAKKCLVDDVPFLYALVYGALEHRAYAEYLLAHYCKRQKRIVRNILLLGITELLFLHTPSHAAVQQAVELAKSMGKTDSTGLINAVLRRIDRERNTLPQLPTDPIERMHVLHGYPAYILRQWINAYGIEAAEQIACARHSSMQVRAQYPYSTDALRSALPVSTTIGLHDQNCLHLEHGFDIAGCELYQNGAMTVQNEGAMMICRALGDIRGKKVLDACAAPGGKTAYLASLCENDAFFTAWDLHPHRKELMDRTFARLHVKAKTACRNATVLHDDAVDAFDAVLLDVPCTGFGLLADKPDLRYRKTESEQDEIVQTQEQILLTCSHYLRSGGVLVYATCTISARENEQQVCSFLNENSAFHLDFERQYLPHTDGIDGFYVAKMIRG